MKKLHTPICGEWQRALVDIHLDGYRQITLHMNIGRLDNGDVYVETHDDLYDNAFGENPMLTTRFVDDVRDMVIDVISESVIDGHPVQYVFELTLHDGQPHSINEIRCDGYLKVDEALNDHKSRWTEDRFDVLDTYWKMDILQDLVNEIETAMG